VEYIKVLGYAKKTGVDGCYIPLLDRIVVDYSYGLFQAFVTSFHEFSHKLQFVALEECNLPLFIVWLFIVPASIILDMLAWIVDTHVRRKGEN